MNGRCYDPILGRFLSPDNYVQAPENSQSFNRYSYCVNNPLKYTNPSGEIFGIDDLIVAAVVIGYMNTYCDVLQGNIHNSNDLLNSFCNGAIQGAIFAVSGGTLNAAAVGKFALNKFVPPAGVNVNLGGGFSLSLTASPSWGTDAVGMSVGGGLNYSHKNISVSVGGDYSFGSSIYGNPDKSYKQSRIYGGGIWNDGKSFVGAYGNYFSNPQSSTVQNGQKTIMATMGKGEVKFAYENDGAWKFLGIPILDGSDKFRTAAASLSIKDWTLNLRMYTGDPLGEDGQKEATIKPDADGIRWYRDSESANAYRMGALSISNRRFMNGMEFGVNSEDVRHFFQNQLVHRPFFGLFQLLGMKGQNAPYFEILKDKFPTKGFIQSRRLPRFSLW